jgi:CHASE1-domain containing sensor protein
VGVSRAISGGIVMALRHFMATHQYLTKDARDASFDPENQSTDREFFEQFTTERAKVLQHWRGVTIFSSATGLQKAKTISTRLWNRAVPQEM